MTTLETYGATKQRYDEVRNFPKCILGRVISQSKRLFKVVTDKGEVNGEVSGRFRHEVSVLADYPAVGDFVAIVVSTSTGKGVIQKVLKRETKFERSEVGKAWQAQVIATNIDTAFICMSLNNNYNLRRLERYLSVAWDSHATPVIILTKADVCDNPNDFLEEVRTVAGDADIIMTSADAPENIKDSLMPFLAPGKTAAFIGSSGVGKSTLVNILAGQSLQLTQEIRETDDKGRHTTSRREMIKLPNGGLVIDTPGMRALGVETVDLESTFQDIEELAIGCKFSDCRHLSEPGCAVRTAVENGTLDASRLENYLRIRQETGN